jgi:8-oxo-dGTP diphosphatase
MSVPRVGVGVFVFKSSQDPHFIVGRRKGSLGSGLYIRPYLYSLPLTQSDAGTIALPGGHLEHGETFEACAAREIKEETGLVIENIQFVTATNTVFKEQGKHYVTIFMLASAVPDPDREGVMPEPEVGFPKGGPVFGFHPRLMPTF